MIKMAFCDDDLSILNQLSVLVNRYRVDRNQEIDYTAFQSPLELLAEIERGARYDILFLDVLMPGGASYGVRKYVFDKDILSTLGQPGGITRAELQRSAGNVLRFALTRMEP